MPHSDRPRPALLDATSHRRGLWWVLILTGSAFLLTAAYSAVSGDVRAANVASWQLATTGDPSLDSLDVPVFENHPVRDVWIVTTPSGHEVIGRSPGAVLAGLPAYLLLGSSTFSLIPGAITAALLTAVSASLVYSTMRQHLKEREAVLGALLFALSTPVWSVAANGVWPHTITVLGICGMAWAASRERWWLVGLFGGVALWGRLHVALLVAVVGLLVGWRRRDPRLVARVALPSAALLGLQCVWTRWMYESWNPVSSYNTEPFEGFAAEHGIDLVNHLGFWVSPDRGLLVWTPLILVMLPAVVRSWRLLPDWSTALVWGGLAYTVLQGTLNRFSGGDAFYGYRLTLELLACLVPAFALSVTRMGSVARAAFPYVAIVQTIVIFAGAVNSGLGTVAERVWYEHSLLTPMLDKQPLALALGLVVVPALGYLSARIWADPSISRTKPTSRLESPQG